MIDTSSSENTESSATDLVTNLFVTLPDLKPEALSEIEYCVFQLFYTFGSASRKISILNNIFLFFNTIQIFAIITMAVIMGSIINQPDELPTFHNILFFTITFQPYKQNISMNPVFFFVINLISMICIGSFFYGISLVHKRRYISANVASLLLLFSVTIPSVLMIVLSNYSIRLIINLILYQKPYWIFQSILMTIDFVLVLGIQVLASKTLYISFQYFHGTYVCFRKFFHLTILFCCLLIVANFCRLVMPDNIILYSLCALYAVYGLFSFFQLFKELLLSQIIVAISYTLSITLIVASILIPFLTRDALSNHDLVLFVIYWFFFVSICVTMLVIIYQFKSKSKKFIETDYKDLNIKSDQDILDYMKIGMTEASPEVMNGNFFEFLLKNQNKIWIKFAVLRFSVIFVNKKPYLQELFNELDMLPGKTISQKYILFEYSKISGMEIKHDIPTRVHSVLEEINMKVTNFHHITEVFASQIGKQLNDDYIFLDLLSSMRNLLYHAMHNMKADFPNCPAVLRLFGSYKEHVEGDLISKKKWCSIADSLDSQQLLFNSFIHIQLADRFPKIKKCYIDKVLAAESENEDTNDQDQVESEKKASVVRKGLTSNALLVYLIIMMICILIFDFMNFAEADSVYHDLEQLVQFMEMYLRVSNRFSNFIYRPVAMIALNETSLNNINRVYYYHDRFRTAADNLMLAFRYKSIDSKAFNRSFDWFTDQIYPIPLTFGHQVINDELYIMLLRYSVLFRTVFSRYEFNSEAPEIPSFIDMAFRGSSYFLSSTKKISDSSESFMEYLYNSAAKVIYISSVPLLVLIIILLFIIIIIYKRQVMELAEMLPNPKIEPFKLPLSSFLSQGYFTLPTILAYFIICSLALILLVILQETSFLFFFKNIQEAVSSTNNYLLNDARQLTYSSASIVGIFISSISEYNHDVSNESILVLLNECISFFFNGTGSNLISFNRANAVTYQLILYLLEQVTPTEIKFDKNFSTDMLTIADTINISLMSNITTEQSHENFKLSRFNGLMRIQIFMLFQFVAFVLIVNSVFRLRRTVNELSRLVKNITEDKNFDIVEYKHQTILDLINHPCVLVDQDNIIVAANLEWYPHFKMTPEEVIGMTINEHSAKFKVVYVDSFYKILMVEEVIDEEELMDKVNRHKKHLEMLKSVIFPKRFLNADEGTKTIDFLVSVGVQIIPKKSDEISPDIIVDDIKNLTLWIENRCSVCSDVDFVRGSGRELHIIFGIDETVRPIELVLHAATAMVDALRWTIENEWKSAGIEIMISISSGGPSTFIVTKKKVEMFGVLFEKQMKLNDQLSPNTIVFDQETVSILSKSKLGFHVMPITDHIYAFRTSNKEDDVFGEQEDQYSRFIPRFE